MNTLRGIEPMNHAGKIVHQDTLRLLGYGCERRSEVKPVGVVHPRLRHAPLLADASVDPLPQEVGVTEVARVLLDHSDQHLTQRH